MKRSGWLALLLLAQSAMAADFKPFLPGSRAAIEQAHAGKPFVLSFWSVDCAYCPKEIRQLGAMVRQRPDIRLVLVSVDGVEQQAAAERKLAEHLPDRLGERWMFAGNDMDRLYFSVDRQWHGELPRTYFYDASGAALGKSGRVDPHWLQQWAQRVTRSNTADEGSHVPRPVVSVQ